MSLGGSRSEETSKFLNPVFHLNFNFQTVFLILLQNFFKLLKFDLILFIYLNLNFLKYM